jgi:hypothetical protein
MILVLSSEMTIANLVIDQPKNEGWVSRFAGLGGNAASLSPGSLPIPSLLSTENRANPRLHLGRLLLVLNRSKQSRPDEARLKKIVLWFNDFTAIFTIGFPRMGES